MITAKDIMSKNPIHLGPQNTMLDASRVMTEKSIRHVEIVDDGKLIGIISDRDVLKAMRADKEDDFHLALSLNSEQKINDYMSWPVYTVKETTTVLKIIEEFLRQKVSAFMVEDQKGVITGIVTIDDVLKHFLETTNLYKYDL